MRLPWNRFALLSLGLCAAVLAAPPASRPADLLHYSHPDQPSLRWEIAAGELRCSTDSGAHWRMLLKRTGLQCVLGDPLRPPRVYFTSALNTYVTDDSWHVRALGGPREGGRLTIDSWGRVYEAAPLGLRPGCWRYAGGTWDRLLDQPVSEVHVDPADPRNITATLSVRGGVHVWQSRDDGLNWSRPRLRGEEANAMVSRRYTLTPEDADYAANPELLAPLIVFRNGSMSEGETLPVAWQRVSGNLIAERDIRKFRSAPASLRAQSRRGQAGLVSQHIVAPGPTRLRVQAALCTQGSGAAELAIEAMDLNGLRIAWRPFAMLHGAAEWNTHTGEFVLPEGTSSFAIALQIEGEQVAWLDDVTLDVYLDGQWKPAATVLDFHTGEPGTPLEASLLPVTPVPGSFPTFPRGWAEWNQRLVQRSRLDAQIVFLGDSLTEQWGLPSQKDLWSTFSRRGAANCAISTERTETLLWRLNHDALHGLRPRLILLMIGGDNLDQNRVEPQDIARGIELVVKRLRESQPQARILLQGILPRERDAKAPVRERIACINTIIARLDDNAAVRYLDFGPKMLDPDGTLAPFLSPDGVHLTQAGYTRWTGAIQEVIEEMMSLPPLSSSPSLGLR